MNRVMDNIKKLISGVKECRRIEQELREKKEKLYSPLLTDVSHLRQIRLWINQIYNDSDRIDLTYSSLKYFLTISILLYSPSMIEGLYMNRGLRKAISEQINLYPTQISHLSKKVCYWLVQYPSFQNSSEYLYNEVKSRIIERGLIDG